MIPGLIPVGTWLDWDKSYTSTPSLSAQGRTEYVEGNGQTLTDAQSVYNGQVIRNVNGSSAAQKRFMRGAATSGGTFGSDTDQLNAGSTVTVEGCAVINPTIVLLCPVTMVTGANVPSGIDMVKIQRIK